MLVLLSNLLVSREPMYGVAEWARNYLPQLFGLQEENLKHLHDDRLGRCLDRVFATHDSNLILDVVRHVVREFDVRLDELHNDSAIMPTRPAKNDGWAARLQPLLGVTTRIIARTSNSCCTS
ncbi:MAG: hypothetical protein CMJ64_14290 [Planctomycetaceae bacterium]|nr:hypothetical protein [Planctomycetaceae bacterium]